VLVVSKSNEGNPHVMETLMKPLLSRRSLGRLAAILLTVSFGGATPVLAADSWPAKPITVVVPYPPGGGTDVLARAVAQKLQQSLGQSVIVDNRPGAGGTVGAAYAAHAAPDGYTLLILNVLSHTATKGLYKNLSFDPVASFTALGLVGATPYVIAVNPSVSARTLAEFVALAKSKPGRINYGSSGAGGISHLSTELFKRQATIDLTHIPYKGDGPVVTDLISGQIQVTFGNVVALLPHIRSGRLRALAVTGDKRLDVLPDVPTVNESGYTNYSVVGQFGFAVPKGTPVDLVKRLNAELVKAAKSPQLIETFAQQGVTAKSSTPEQMQDMMKEQQQTWTKLIKELGITAD
jgi:tripartite-type tricarboxylate transporter receptor subunit TctC